MENEVKNDISEKAEETKKEQETALGRSPHVEVKEETGPNWAELGPQLQAKLDALSENFNAYKASVSLGITDWDHFEVIKWQWEKGDKSSDITSWIEGMINGKVSIPKTVAPFLSQKVETPVKDQQLPKVVAPSTVAGTGISTKISSEKLAEARRKAALGDPTDLRLLLGRELKKK